MKKQIAITTQSIKTVEVEVPSYYDNHGMYIAITDQSVIKISKEGLFASVWTSSQADHYSEAIVEVLKWEPLAITAEEFDIAFNNTIKCLTEQYQLSKSMYDPNVKEAEQATEQVNATESAAQDSAMEVSSEEGSSEG